MTHFLNLVVEDGEPRVTFTCTATPDALCRRRPPNEDELDGWTDEQATEPGHPCWAADWYDHWGLEAITGSDGTLASVPVHIWYEEGVHFEPKTPQDELDLDLGRSLTNGEIAALKARNKEEA